MSQSPYMRAHFENDVEKDRQERETKAEVERKAQEDKQRAQDFKDYVAKLKPTLEQVAEDAKMLNRTGVTSAQIFTSHAALSADLGVADENRAVASLTVRIESDNKVNVSISMLDADPAFTNRRVGNIDEVGFINDADIIQKLDESIYRAIASAMKAAAA